MTVRRVATVVTIALFLVVAAGLCLARYEAGKDVTSFIQSSLRPILIATAVMGAVLAAVGFVQRGVALGCAVLAIAALVLLNRYAVAWPQLWMHHAVIAGCVFSFLCSFAIATTEEEQTRFFRFVRESYVETTQKSAWPTWKELRQLTIVVIFAILVVAIWIGGIDSVLTFITAKL